MNALNKLGETMNARMHEVVDYATSDVPVESGVIIEGLGLQVESLDSIIPPSDYLIMSGTVSVGDRVIVVWTEEDPVIIGVMGGGGGSNLFEELFMWADIPQSAAERQSNTDELGNAIYDIGFNDVTVE